MQEIKSGAEIILESKYIPAARTPLPPQHLWDALWRRPNDRDWSVEMRALTAFIDLTGCRRTSIARLLRGRVHFMIDMIEDPAVSLTEALESPTVKLVEVRVDWNSTKTNRKGLRKLPTFIRRDDAAFLLWDLGLLARKSPLALFCPETLLTVWEKAIRQWCTEHGTQWGWRANRRRVLTRTAVQWGTEEAQRLAGHATVAQTLQYLNRSL